MMHITSVNTQENKKGEEATQKPIWPIITTGLTDQTSCTHYTDLTGVENQFDRLADLVSNNKSNKKDILLHTIRYNPRI
jgi:hypothetical protein